MRDPTPQPEAALIELTLPYPPSVNRYWRRVGTQTLISREGRRYRGAVAAAVIEALGVPIPSLGDAPLEVAIIVTPPDHRRRDLDNILKALFDALESLNLFQDDSQIAVISISREKPRPPGHVSVTIATVSPAPAKMGGKPRAVHEKRSLCPGATSPNNSSQRPES